MNAAAWPSKSRPPRKDIPPHAWRPTSPTSRQNSPCPRPAHRRKGDRVRRTGGAPRRRRPDARARIAPASRISPPPGRHAPFASASADRFPPAGTRPRGPSIRTACACGRNRRAGRDRRCRRGPAARSPAACGRGRARSRCRSAPRPAAGSCPAAGACPDWPDVARQSPARPARCGAPAPASDVQACPARLQRHLATNCSTMAETMRGRS